VNFRFFAAMFGYVLLAVLAGFTLTGDVRLVTWIILGLIAFRTWLVVLKNRAE
jgi:hypothetical protein